MIQNQNCFVSGSYPPQHRCHHPPGELGKALGVPEVRTLREKITRMTATGNPGQWMRDLAKTRMQDDPAEAGYLYIDGHVRVDHGSDEIPGATRIAYRAETALVGLLRRHPETSHRFIDELV